MQNYKTHSSNGVVYCFFKDRVFITCMDEECRKELAHSRCCFKIMNRVLEEDIFARYLKRGGGRGKAGGGGSGAGQQQQQHIKARVPPAMTAASATIKPRGLAAPGLTPSMLQDNPSRRVFPGSACCDETNSQSSSSGSESHRACLSTEKYFDSLTQCNLDSVEVRNRLSRQQYQFLVDMKHRVDKLQTTLPAAKDSTAAQPEKINLRAISKVPSR